MTITNKKIFITGGAGYLGKSLVDRLYKDNEICIYSRDEAKHYFLKKQYPNIKTKSLNTHLYGKTNEGYERGLSMKLCMGITSSSNNGKQLSI